MKKVNNLLVEILAMIGGLTVAKWIIHLGYWYFITDRSGNAGRYKHWEDNEGGR